MDASESDAGWGANRNRRLGAALVASDGPEEEIGSVAPVDDRPPVENDDLPPSGQDARAQWTAPVMPAIWAVLALCVVAAFVAFLFFAKEQGPAPEQRNPVAVPPPGAPPTK